MQPLPDQSDDTRWLQLQGEAALTFDGQLPPGINRLMIKEATLDHTQLQKVWQNSDSLQALHLEELGLPDGLPAMLYSLERLQSLSLIMISPGEDFGEDEDFIQSLPDGIAALSALKELELCENELTSLPSDMHQLPLDALDLSDNSLSAKAIPALPGTLRSLTVSYNPLGEVPEAIRQCSQLEELDLGSCQLSTLPGWLAELPIKTLRLSHNTGLQDLEHAFAIPTLEVLDLSSCGLESLPAHMDKAVRLRELSLTHNPLRQLRENIGQLQALEVLKADRCALSYIHEALTSLGKLRTLVLSNNELKQLPRSFSKLHALELLRVSHNELSQLPDMSGLHALKQVDLSRNKLQTFPLSLYDCSALEVLEMNWNNVDQIGPSLAKLQNLRSLSVYSNYLLFFNDKVSELKQLEKLNLGYTRIKKLPDLSGCQSLKELNLAGLYEIEDMQDALKTFNCPWIHSLTLTDNHALQDLPPNLDGFTQLKRINVNKTALDSAQLRARFPGTVIWP